MKFRFFMILSITVSIFSLKSFGQSIVLLSDFGVQPNSFINASPALKRAIESCKGKQNIVLQMLGGRIDLWPEGAFKKELYISNTTEDDKRTKEKNIGFMLDGNQHVTIDGNNSLVVLHGKMESFVFLNCKDVVLKNIRFDYERPTMSEMTIVSATNKEVKVQMHPDSRFYIEKGKIGFYGEGWRSNSFHTISCFPNEGTMYYSSFSPFLKSQAKQMGCREVTFTGDFSEENYQPGSILTIRDPYRDNSGAFICRSENIRLENVQMNYMHGLGIVSQFSENITYHKVTAAPAKDSGRQIASFADCFHFSGCKGKILIDSCYTFGSHDDPINVHGTHLKITRIDNGNVLTVSFMHHQTYGFEAFFAGDSIAFINPQTLMPISMGRLKQARLVNLREMELVIDGTLSPKVKAGDCIENITWTPEVTIRNSRFEKTNTRGLLITTRRKVLIENNTFFRTGMHAILIANDASSWFESGAVSDVTIRNNRFEECGYNSAPGNYVIAISPENHEQVPGFMVHRNIRIENNLFKVYDYPVLTARSTGNLIFTGNKIVRTDFMKPQGDKRAQFYFNACNAVRVKSNTFDGFGQADIQADNMEKKDISSDLKVSFYNQKQ